MIFKKIWPVLPLLLLAALIPLNKPAVVDLVSGAPAQGYAVAWPLWRYAAEPFAFTGEYVLSFSRYIFQVLSWLFWCGAAVAVFGIAGKAALRVIIGRILAAWLIILTVIMFVVLLPLPAPRLTVPAGRFACDFHSHTWYSHDGVVSPAQSLNYHRRLGFERFFDTEHNHTNGFSRFPGNTRFSTVFPGMEIVTREMLSLLILADRQFDAREFRDKTVKEVIDLAHARGFLAVCPHWWKWRHFTWEELAARGIDGFEVYNAGYRNFPDTEREQLIRFCKSRNLLMFGTTDWHGWGSMSNVWTVADYPGAGGEDFFSGLRQRRPLQVLVYRRPELQTTFRYLFEPFFGIYYMVTGINLLQAAGWSAWVLFLSVVLPRISGRKIMRGISAGAAMLLFGLIVRCLIVWIPLLPENMILGRLLAPLLAVLCFGWLIVLRYYGKTTEQA